MENKCVIIVNQDLPIGLIANSCAVLSLTLGKEVEGILGEDILDKSGLLHKGITRQVLPILKTNLKNLTTLWKAAKAKEDVLVVDFSNVAQRTKTYKDYANQLAETNSEDLRYFGIAIYGSKKAVNSLSGSLPLLR